jgi:hypothetical protein
VPRTGPPSEPAWIVIVASATDSLPSGRSSLAVPVPPGRDRDLIGARRGEYPVRPGRGPVGDGQLERQSLAGRRKAEGFYGISGERPSESIE